jgi:Mn2+/Fe2+ NRAMP family transporter
LPYIRIVNDSDLDLVSESASITIFKIANLLDGLGSLIICTYNLTILTKRKKQPAIADRTRSVVKSLSTHVSIDLAKVSVQAEHG